MPEPIVLRTLTEAVEDLRVSKSTLFREIRAGRIRVVKIRGRTFITSREVEAYLASRVRRIA